MEIQEIKERLRLSDVLSHYGLPIKLDLRHLPSGSYFLRLHAQGEVYAQRLEKRD